MFVKQCRGATKSVERPLKRRACRFGRLLRFRLARFAVERGYASPPGYDALHARGLEGFAEPRHDDFCATPGCELEQGFDRLVPGVKREVEGAPVNRQKATAAEQRQRLERIFRTQVNVAPGGMES